MFFYTKWTGVSIPLSNINLFLMPPSTACAMRLSFTYNYDMKYVFEGLLHPKKVDKLGVLPTLLHNTLYVKFRLFNKVIDCLNAAEHAVLVLVPINPEIRLPRDQQAIFINQTPNAESQVITGFLHEIWRGWRHENLHTWVRIFLNLLLALFMLRSLQLVKGFLK